MNGTGIASRATWPTVRIETDLATYVGQVCVPETKRRLSDVLADERPFLHLVQVQINDGDEREPFLALNKTFIRTAPHRRRGEGRSRPGRALVLRPAYLASRPVGAELVVEGLGVDAQRLGRPAAMSLVLVAAPSGCTPSPPRPGSCRSGSPPSSPRPWLRGAGRRAPGSRAWRAPPRAASPSGARGCCPATDRPRAFAPRARLRLLGLPPGFFEEVARRGGRCPPSGRAGAEADKVTPLSRK